MVILLIEKFEFKKKLISLGDLFVSHLKYAVTGGNRIKKKKFKKLEKVSKEELLK